mmetsp:Transcript_46262/g.83624  ORF Transcript_46262/g.83624 Transcript_46262/m.83624 type:complete len:201 (-) Transcript_46262:8-610(-)
MLAACQCCAIGNGQEVIEDVQPYPAVAEVQKELVEVSQKTVFLNKEEKEKSQVSRMRDEVLAFSRQAVKGCPCTYVTDSGKRLAAKYVMDPSATKFQVRAEELKQAVTCQLRGLKNILRPEEDEDKFPQAVLKSVEAEERSCLFMILSSDGQGEGAKISRMCLVVESPAARDQCLQCLTFLAMYAAEKTSDKKSESSAQS